MRKYVTTLLVLLVTLPVGAQTVSVVQEDVAYAGSMYYFHQRKVARSSTGVLMVAWNSSGSAAGSQVYASVYDADFGTWGPAVAISAAPAAGLALQPALAADEQGNVHATWQQRETSTAKHQIFYSKYSGGVWATPKQISPAATGRGEEATIEVDSRGYLWVVYNNDGEGTGVENLYAISSTDGGTTWSSSATPLSSLTTFGSSIEVGRAAVTPGPDGKLVVAWDNSRTGTLARREVFVNKYDGSAWGGDAMVSDTTDVDRDHNRYVAACVDAQSNIYLFYSLPIVSGTDPRLSYTVMQKNGWNDPWNPQGIVRLDSSEFNYLSISSVVDSAGVIHLAHRRDVAADTVVGIDEMVYRFSKDNGTTWSDPIVVSREYHDAGYISIANRVRRAYGVDMAWREGRDTMASDPTNTSVVYGNIPYSLITSVGDNPLPVTYETLTNYPNPFNPLTTLAFDVAVRGPVRVTVYDLLGREVATVVDEILEAGSHIARWDGTTRAGSVAATGVYVARLTTSSGSRTLNMMLMK